MIQKILQSLPLFLLLSAITCSSSGGDNSVTGSMIGTATTSNGGYYILNSEIDSSAVSSCGSVTTDSSEDDSSTTTLYEIDSYYYLITGEQILLRFKYDTSEDGYSFSPLLTASTTCNTSDYISCDSAGTGTCETSDSVKCGAAQTFIFTTSTPTDINFVTSSGSVEWDGNINLNTALTAVENMDLNFTLIASDGSTFEGEIHCNL